MEASCLDGWIVATAYFCYLYSFYERSCMSMLDIMHWLSQKNYHENVNVSPLINRI